MKQQLVYTCEEITTGKAQRSQHGYGGTKMYTIKGACQNFVNRQNAVWVRNGGDPLYELVTYALKRVNSDTI